MPFIIFLCKSRDSDLTEAIEEIAANPPSSEMKAVVKELEDEKDKLKKENKDLKNQIKKFKRAKSGQGAIEVRNIFQFGKMFLLHIKNFCEEISCYNHMDVNILGSLGGRTRLRTGSQRKYRS